MSIILLTLFLGCSQSTIHKTTNTIDFSAVPLIESSHISAHYIKHTSVESTASLSVEIDALGNKSYHNIDFSFTIDSKGGTTFNKESKFFVGSFKTISNLNGSLHPFNRKKRTTKTDRDYLLEILHYKLIKKARNSGADAFLGDIDYEWRIVEKSKLETKFFGLRTSILHKQIIYEVTAYAKTAKLVIDPYVGGTVQKTSDKPSMDIMLNLDISTDSPPTEKKSVEEKKNRSNLKELTTKQ